MVQVQQCILRFAGAGALWLLLWPADVEARKFYADDPLTAEPAPMRVEKAKRRKINEYYDFFQNTFWEPDKDLKKKHEPRPSAAINTLGEVPDSTWFTNRIGSRPMSMEELLRGP